VTQGRAEPNAIDVILNVPADGLRARLKRNFVMSSSCGVCGKTSIDSIRRRVTPPADSARVAPATLLALSEKLRAGQRCLPRREDSTAPRFSLSTARCSRFARTSGVTTRSTGDRIRADEAMVPLAQHIMMVSGRLSFEIVQKAAAAGVPILAAVSAPSSLAVELATRSARRSSAFCATAASTSTLAPTESRNHVIPHVGETEKYDLTIYAGTAWYYARYRPKYPPSLVKVLREQFRLDGTGRLLDLGCGPGPVAIALAHLFEDVSRWIRRRNAREASASRRRGVSNMNGDMWLEGFDIRARSVPPRHDGQTRSTGWIGRERWTRSTISSRTVEA